MCDGVDEDDADADEDDACHHDDDYDDAEGAAMMTRMTTIMRTTPMR